MSVLMRREYYLSEIEYGDSYWVNGVAYAASGYRIQFAPDNIVCHSTVNLTLRVGPFYLCCLGRICYTMGAQAAQMPIKLKMRLN